MSRWFSWLPVVVLCSAPSLLAEDTSLRSDRTGLFEGRCAGCHALQYETRTPRLAGVFGRRAGSIRAYPYSTAMRNANIVWTAANLDRFLTDTDVFLPGNAMSIQVPEPEVRAAIIEYLRRRSRLDRRR